MYHFVESVRIWGYFGPHFPAFGLNTERYGVSLRTQSECGKMRTRKTPNMYTFHVVYMYTFSSCLLQHCNIYYLCHNVCMLSHALHDLVFNLL